MTKLTCSVSRRVRSGKNTQRTQRNLYLNLFEYISLVLVPPVLLHAGVALVPSMVIEKDSLVFSKVSCYATIAEVS